MGLASELHGEILSEGRMIRRKLDIVWIFHVMYRWFGVVPQGLLEFLLFFLFDDFRSFFMEFLWGSFGGVYLRDSCRMSRMRTLCVFAWWSCSNNTSETASIWGVFGGFHVKVFLRVDFRFLLIEWVLETELLTKGSPWRTPAIPKVSLWSVERIGRSIAWKVEFFPWAEFFPTVQIKLARPVSQTGLPV
jgi:hypothetical protein